MFKGDPKKIQTGRRDFIKTTSLAGVAATLPGTGLVSQKIESPSKPGTDEMKKELLCLSDSLETHEQFIESIKSIPGTDIPVSSIEVNYQKPQEIIQTIHRQNADILLICLSRFIFNFGSLYDSIGDLNIPVIILTADPELILIEANLAASLRANGANVTLALSQEQALELVKVAASPKILEGRQALIYGRPFDSTSIPAHNLSEYLVYKRTGVMVRYRPIEELVELFKDIDETKARSEMARWKNEAEEVIQVSDKTILDACRLYVLLRSIMEKEELSAISIDCLSFTLSPNPLLPYPCLAFARLRDEGITASCEADVSGMLSSMFLQEISRKPSFMCNVNSVNPQKSTIVLSHCTAPLKLKGSNAAPMKYRLHDYHGFERGVVPEVEFPLGTEVMTGSFTKDLKSFLLWPGRIQTQVRDTDRSSSGNRITLDVCANTIDVVIRDTDRFLQKIPGIHLVMIAGNHTKAIEDALSGMNVNLVGPSDFTSPVM